MKDFGESIGSDVPMPDNEVDLMTQLYGTPKTSAPIMQMRKRIAVAEMPLAGDVTEEDAQTAAEIVTIMAPERTDSLRGIVSLTLHGEFPKADYAGKLQVSSEVVLRSEGAKPESMFFGRDTAVKPNQPSFIFESVEPPLSSNAVRAALDDALHYLSVRPKGPGADS